jgi:site-specific recombinase XerD
MQKRITLKIAHDLFILECQSRRFTAHTLRFYRGRLSLFLRWCDAEGIDELADLTHHHIRKYFISVQDRGVSSSYQESFARAIRSFLNYCVRDELLDESPFKKVQPPRLEKKVLAAIDKASIKLIIEACKTERDKAICLVMLDSGVRASELCALSVGDVDMISGEVKVQMGKGQKGRVTYIGPKTRKQVLRYFAKERNGQPDPKEPLFPSHNTGKHLKYYGLTQMLAAIAKETGVKFSAHAFRRTFAINSIRNGMNIYILAKLMGHTGIVILRAYLSILDDDLQTAHEKYGVVDNL